MAVLHFTITREIKSPYATLGLDQAWPVLVYFENDSFLQVPVLCSWYYLIYHRSNSVRWNKPVAFDHQCTRWCCTGNFVKSVATCMRLHDDKAICAKNQAITFQYSTDFRFFRRNIKNNIDPNTCTSSKNGLVEGMNQSSHA